MNLNLPISSKRILHPTPDGGVAILLPGRGWAPEDVARKDVPAGVPFLIVDMDELPVKDETRNQWYADFDNPDGYGIGPEAWFAEQEELRLADEALAAKIEDGSDADH